MIDRRDFMGAIAGAAIAPSIPLEKVYERAARPELTPLQRKVLDSFTFPLTFEEWHAKYGGGIALTPSGSMPL